MACLGDVCTLPIIVMTVVIAAASMRRPKRLSAAFVNTANVSGRDGAACAVRSDRHKFRAGATAFGSIVLDRQSARLSRLAKTRQDGIKLAKMLSGFVIGDGRCDDDVFTLFPVSWRCDLVVSRQLDRINGTEEFIKVAPGCHRVGQ